MLLLQTTNCKAPLPLAVPPLLFSAVRPTCHCLSHRKTPSSAEEPPAPPQNTRLHGGTPSSNTEPPAPPQNLRPAPSSRIAATFCTISCALPQQQHSIVFHVIFEKAAAGPRAGPCTSDMKIQTATPGLGGSSGAAARGSINHVPRDPVPIGHIDFGPHSFFNR